MKTFKFNAKQGQHFDVIRILFREIGVKPRVKITSNGILITVELPDGISKKSVDRLLHREGVPGASPRHNRMIVSRMYGKAYERAYHDFPLGKKFVVVTNSGFVVAKMDLSYPPCSCCEPTREMVDLKGNHVWPRG